MAELCTSHPLKSEGDETEVELLQIFEMCYSLTDFFKFGTSLKSLSQTTERKSSFHSRYYDVQSFLLKSLIFPLQFPGILFTFV